MAVKKTLHDASPVVCKAQYWIFWILSPFLANFGSGKIRLKNWCTVMAENPQTKNAERIHLLHLKGGRYMANTSSLKGVWHEQVFFHESVSATPVSILLMQFRIYYENSRRYSRQNVWLWGSKGCYREEETDWGGEGRGEGRVCTGPEARWGRFHIIAFRPELYFLFSSRTNTVRMDICEQF